ncbi:MAG: hypothetical protein FWD27_09740 [Coriobacteriia bacterium]|nr:hypothetical protein [Coriobacteriia bacterium]
MMGKTAKTIALLLSFLLLLGCSNQNAEHDNNSAPLNTAGGVSEINAALPGSVEEIVALSCSKDGKTVYALTGGYLPVSSLFEEASDARTLLWATQDQGKTWEPVYNLPAEIDDSNYSDEVGIFAGAINAVGDCIIIKNSNKAELSAPLDDLTTPPLDFFFIGRDGDFFEIDYEFNIVYMPHVSFVADSRALIFDYTKAFLVDTTDGKIIAKYDTANDLGMSLAAAPVTDDIFLIAGHEEIQCYYGSTGKPCDTPPGLGAMFEEVFAGLSLSLVLYSSEKALYCSDAKSVYEYLPESDRYERLFSFSELMLQGGEPYLLSFAVDGKKTSYLVYYSMNHNQAVTFSAYILEPQLVDGQSISVYTLESNAMLNSAILTFQNSSPEITWTIEVGIDGVNALTGEDAIRQLNLRLLAGEGPDIILLDGLPIDAYIEKQVLADIASVLDSEANIPDTFFSNIVSAYAHEEKLYAIPASFRFYGAQGTKSFIEQASAVEPLASQLVKEAQAGLFSSYENEYTSADTYFSKYLSTVKVLYSLYSPALIKGGRVDLSMLESYFSSCMALQVAMGEEIGRASIDKEPTSILWQALDSISGSSQNGIGVVAGAIELSALLQQQRNSQVAWLPIMTTGAFFEPHMTIGINSSSSYKNEAEAFLSYMLSSEFQETLFSAFPVKKDAFASVLRDTNEDDDGHLHIEEGGLLFESWFPEEDRSIYVYYPEDESEIMACIDLMDALSVPITEDAAVRDIVLEGLVNYLNGHTTLSQTLSHVENRANLYLAE